ncbi:META domain-containing protein [Riemerella anatipestifer]|uniref:META domain-containing protein n=1 Tax=Riemerella anatipestifer TaxID=34085 RepID=A0AAP3AML6_RIEAN|nr:META domain-containing protein [Riemerella anatipestifer]MBT0572018.1 META domain-containing protein [Riemerella anatipestifer]MCU7567664.1 META domain-containing protein [Riemerella anatipestifer]MCW0489655.1 META domain-containing protein [Riemerella anatipestifer]MCW0523279.1 META domain-containing protein [Riemerella anatipestifer]MDR7796163.1 META domain-containing protein [Riemerella anatipestifer]
MKNIILTLGIGLLMFSCATVGNTTTTKSKKNQVSLLSTEWVLAESRLGSSKVPTLTVETEKVSGNSGCNNYFGQLKTDAQTGAFSVENVGSTRMACKDMLVEQNFLKMLEKANRYESDGITLTLYKDQLPLMKFSKK